MDPRQPPQAIDGELASLHLLGHRLSDDTLAGKKPAAGVALEARKLPALRELAGVNRAL